MVPEATNQHGAMDDFFEITQTTIRSPEERCVLFGPPRDSIFRVLQGSDFDLCSQNTRMAKRSEKGRGCGFFRWCNRRKRNKMAGTTSSEEQDSVINQLKETCECDELRKEIEQLREERKEDAVQLLTSRFRKAEMEIELNKAKQKILALELELQSVQMNNIIEKEKLKAEYFSVLERVLSGQILKQDQNAANGMQDEMRNF
jgi:hypothetical protein